MNETVIKSKLFKETFGSFWPKWREKKSKYADLRFWWEESKEKIRDIAIWCSKKLKQSQEVIIKEIESELNILQNSSVTNYEKIGMLNEELKTIYQTMAEGARVRAKIQWAEEGNVIGIFP